MKYFKNATDSNMYQLHAQRQAHQKKLRQPNVLILLYTTNVITRWTVMSLCLGYIQDWWQHVHVIILQWYNYFTESNLPRTTSDIKTSCGNKKAAKQHLADESNTISLGTETYHLYNNCYNAGSCIMYCMTWWTSVNNATKFNTWTNNWKTYDSTVYLQHKQLSSHNRLSTRGVAMGIYRYIIYVLSKSDQVNFSAFIQISVINHNVVSFAIRLCNITWYIFSDLITLGLCCYLCTVKHNEYWNFIPPQNKHLATPLLSTVVSKHRTFIYNLHTPCVGKTTRCYAPRSW